MNQLLIFLHLKDCCIFSNSINFNVQDPVANVTYEAFSEPLTSVPTNWVNAFLK